MAAVGIGFQEASLVAAAVVLKVLQAQRAVRERDGLAVLALRAQVLVSVDVAVVVESSALMA